MLKIKTVRSAARDFFDLALSDICFYRKETGSNSVDNLTYIRPTDSEGLLHGFSIYILKMGDVIVFEPTLGVHHDGICRIFENFMLPKYNKIYLENFYKFSNIVISGKLIEIIKKHYRDREVFVNDYSIISNDDIDAVLRKILEDFYDVHKIFYENKKDIERLRNCLKMHSVDALGPHSIIMCLASYMYQNKYEELEAYIKELESEYEKRGKAGYEETRPVVIEAAGSKLHLTPRSSGMSPLLREFISYIRDTILPNQTQQ